MHHILRVARVDPRAEVRHELVIACPHQPVEALVDVHVDGRIVHFVIDPGDLDQMPIDRKVGDLRIVEFGDLAAGAIAHYAAEHASCLVVDLRAFRAGELLVLATFCGRPAILGAVEIFAIACLGDQFVPGQWIRHQFRAVMAGLAVRASRLEPAAFPLDTIYRPRRSLELRDLARLQAALTLLEVGRLDKGIAPAGQHKSYGVRHAGLRCCYRWRRIGAVGDGTGKAQPRKRNEAGRAAAEIVVQCCHANPVT